MKVDVTVSHQTFRFVSTPLISLSLVPIRRYLNLTPSYHLHLFFFTFWFVPLMWQIIQLNEFLLNSEWTCGKLQAMFRVKVLNTVPYESTRRGKQQQQQQVLQAA